MVCGFWFLVAWWFALSARLCRWDSVLGWWFGFWFGVIGSGFSFCLFGVGFGSGFGFGFGFASGFWLLVIF